MKNDISVGEWDWEAFEAHRRGLVALPQREIEDILMSRGRAELGEA